MWDNKSYYLTDNELWNSYVQDDLFLTWLWTSDVNKLIRHLDLYGKKVYF